MGACYPNRWRSAMGESPNNDDGTLTVYGDTWAKGLAGLTGADLGRGLEACITRSSEWPPVLAEFRAMCLGIPSFAEVRADMARQNADREPFTLMVAAKIDGYRFRHADMREADRMLREAYEDAREARMRGEPLPEALVKLKHDAPPVKPASPEVARAALAAMAAELNIGARVQDEAEFPSA